MWNLSRISACHCSARCGGPRTASAVDLAAVEQLAGDEQRLDGLADADVVGDRAGGSGRPQGHEQRHELVRARLDRDPAEAAERSGAVADRQPQGLVEQTRGRVVAEVGGRRRREGRGPDVVALEREVDARDLVVGAAERAQDEERVVGLGQDDPLAAAGPDEAARA